MLIAGRLLGLGDAADGTALGTYVIAIQVGAIAAVLGLYRSRVSQIVRGALGRDLEGRRLLAALAADVRQFVPDGRPLRTDDLDELRTMASAFGGVFEAEHDHAGVVTNVSHTDQTYVVDDTGQVVLTWTAAMTTEDVANDLEILVGEIAHEP